MGVRVLAVAALILGLAGCTPPPPAPVAATSPWQGMPLTAAGYDQETQDFGVAPTNALRTSQFEAPTPTTIAGAQTITTPALRAMMISATPPLLIDVLNGKRAKSLPGAVNWQWAGLGGGSLDDATQAQLRDALARATGGDLQKPLVIFCLSKTCWLSHNAVVRAVALGYRNVYWYRGGLQAWLAAGLPTLTLN